MATINYYELPFIGDICNGEDECIDSKKSTMRYTQQFPMEWAKSHLHGTGPECANCLAYGVWNGVFVGYCTNCARNYKFERGYGCGGSDISFGEDAPYDAITSMGNTYLKGVFLSEIGDPDFNNGRQICTNIFPTIKRDISVADTYHANHELFNHPQIICLWNRFNNTMMDFGKLANNERVPIHIWMKWLITDLCMYDNNSSYENVKIDGHVE